GQSRGCRNVEIDVVGYSHRLRATQSECSVDEHERRWAANKRKCADVDIENRCHGRALIHSKDIELCGRSCTCDCRICTACKYCITDVSANRHVERTIVDHVTMESQLIGDDCAHIRHSELRSGIHVQVAKHLNVLCRSILKTEHTGCDVQITGDGQRSGSYGVNQDLSGSPSLRGNITLSVYVCL